MPASSILGVLLEASAGVDPMSDFRGVAGGTSLKFMRAIWRWFKVWFGVARSVWITHVLAVSAFVVFVALEMLGTQEWAVAVLGVQPDKLWTFVSHAVVHDGWAHLITNLLVLELFGPFIERWLRSLLYGSAVLLITLLGAYLSVELVPEYWVEGSNPVGMSISGYALESVGIYLAARTVIHRQRYRIRVLVSSVKREWVSWVAVMVTVAVMTFFLWAGSDFTEGPAEVGHTTGAIMGVIVTVVNAFIRTCRGGAIELGNDAQADG